MENLPTKRMLFIDFNGVISYKPFWFSLKDPGHPLFKIGNAVEDYLFKSNREIVKDWMFGKYTSEEVHLILKENIQDEFDVEDLYEVFCEDCRNLDISKNILNELRKLKDHYYLVLMTDNMDSFDRYTLPAHPELNEVFDEINNSYNVRCSKRDNNCEIFTRYIDTYDVHKSESIFLDDSQRNCDAYKEHIQGVSICVSNEEEVLSALAKINTGGY